MAGPASKDFPAVTNPNDPAAGHAAVVDDAAPGRAAGTSPARPLRAQPEGRDPTAWREPPWFPPDRDRHRRERGPHLVSIVVGLALVLVGIYYFLDRTLGIPMPPIAWGSLWPVLLIVLGAVILLRSVERRH